MDFGFWILDIGYWILDFGFSTENTYLDAKRTGRAKAASHLKGEIPFVLAVHFPVIKLTNT